MANDYLSSSLKNLNVVDMDKDRCINTGLYQSNGNIYIRHANKEYKNGKSDKYSHDPPILAEQEEDIGRLVNNLIDRYGYPKLIICSPYLRCRQTADEIIKMLGYDVPIKVDNRISEFLGHHQYQSVHDDTAKYNPPHPEKFFQFQRRVTDFYYSTPKTNGCWIITHGIVIKTIHRLKTMNKSSEIDCLGYMEM